MVRREPNAFTLIELLVVISIVALLIALLLPAIKQAKESARLVACLSNERQQGVTMLNYVTENHDHFAGSWSFGGPGAKLLSVFERLEDYGPTQHRLAAIGEGSQSEMTGPGLHGENIWACPSDPVGSVETWNHPGLGGWYHHGFYHFGDRRQYHVSYAINTQDWTNTGRVLERTPFGIYSLYTGIGRRTIDVEQPSSTMIFCDGSLARGWTFWSPPSGTGLENECFHNPGSANVVAVDGHAEIADCQPSFGGYTRTDWTIIEPWYRIDQ